MQFRDLTNSRFRNLGYDMLIIYVGRERAQEIHYPF
jgi:hypothetical protein